MPVTNFRFRIPKSVVLSLAALLLAGFALFRDYGISWDEIPTREFGLAYVQHQVPDIQALDALRAEKGFAWERHGPVFEIGLVWMERLAGFTDMRQVFFARHLATFLVFVLAVGLFYAFCRRRFSEGIALFAAASLVFTPVLFANAFYNNKDIPFLALFIATMLSLVAWLERPAWRGVIVHAVLTAMLVSTRVLGFLAFGLTIGLVLWRHRSRDAVARVAVYAVLVMALLPVFWPVLRIDYWGVLSQALLNASSNTLSPRSVLFWGQHISPQHLPWHYVPSWVLVTTPIPYQLLMLAGVVVIVMRWSAEWRAVLRAPGQDVVVACWLITPLASTLLLRPILYDGWRHMFFIYPALLYLGACGAEELWRRGEPWMRTRPAWMRRAVTIGATAACLAPAASFMVTSHPFEHLYFNRFAGANLAVARDRFDFDFWGLSYRPMLEQLARIDQSPAIRVRVENYPGVANSVMLDPSDRRRIQYAKSLDEADYFITNFRFPDDPRPATGELFSLRLGTATVASLYRLHQP
jgi:hypothetical protein